MVSSDLGKSTTPSSFFPSLHTPLQAQGVGGSIFHILTRTPTRRDQQKTCKTSSSRISVLKLQLPVDSVDLLLGKEGAVFSKSAGRCVTGPWRASSSPRVPRVVCRSHTSSQTMTASSRTLMSMTVNTLVGFPDESADDNDLSELPTSQ